MESYSLQKLVPAYRELNEFYKNILSSKSIGYKSQKRITDFYLVNSNERFFEEMLLKSLHEDGNEFFIKSIPVLYELIKENIDLYKKHRSFLSEIDIHHICSVEERKFNSSINKQLALLKPISEKICRLESSLESASWNNDSIKTKELEKAIEEARIAHDKEKIILDKLYLEKQALSKEVAQYSMNIFSDIYSLGNSYLKILGQYNKSESPSFIMNKTTQPPPNPEEKIYFDMEQISKIHTICNDRQFHGVSQLHFFKFFNLIDVPALVIIDGEIQRVQYLIHKLSSILDKDSKKYWLPGILTNLEILYETYKKKHTHCCSAQANRYDLAFARRIDPLFENIHVPTRKH
jgi:hypothetical protein